MKLESVMKEERQHRRNIFMYFLFSTQKYLYEFNKTNQNTQINQKCQKNMLSHHGK